MKYYLTHHFLLGTRQTGAYSHAIWLYLPLSTLVLAIILYFAFIYIEAKLEVKSSPREAMYECEKHGIFRKKHLISFMTNPDTGEPYYYCPRCLHEKIHTRLDASVNPR